MHLNRCHALAPNSQTFHEQTTDISILLLFTSVNSLCHLSLLEQKLVCKPDSVRFEWPESGFHVHLQLAITKVTSVSVIFFVH